MRRAISAGKTNARAEQRKRKFHPHSRNTDGSCTTQKNRPLAPDNNDTILGDILLSHRLTSTPSLSKEKVCPHSRSHGGIERPTWTRYRAGGGLTSAAAAAAASASAAAPCPVQPVWPHVCLAGDIHHPVLLVFRTQLPSSAAGNTKIGCLVQPGRHCCWTFTIPNLPCAHSRTPPSCYGQHQP